MGTAQESDKIAQLKEYIKNGQLVVYSESSILLDSNSSSITYVDFCPDGNYYLNYEGSYTVRGTQNTSNRDNRGYGAGTSASSGTWDIIMNMNAFYLAAKDQSGGVNYYPININNLLSGKWKVGNTTYVFAQNHAKCL
ncbi:MAG: hypothetical protein AAF348_03210 [Bacteroidota bacterium]